MYKIKLYNTEQENKIEKCYFFKIFIIILFFFTILSQYHIIVSYYLAYLVLYYTGNTCTPAYSFMQSASHVAAAQCTNLCRYRSVNVHIQHQNGEQCDQSLLFCLFFFHNLDLQLEWAGIQVFLIKWIYM